MRTMYNYPIPHVPGAGNFSPAYPNPADFRFNYYTLLELARQNKNAIGNAPASRPRVAIIGGGVAGMTAARELYRCGYKLTMYEATDRLCGRHYTKPISGQTTAMELGAMRFPYFSNPGSTNSAFSYYLSGEANATAAPFPNPGSAPGNTGIYVNEGWGPEGEFYPNKKMILWPAGGTYNPPDDPYLQAVYDKVNAFVTLFSKTVAPIYATPGPAWPDMWRQIANNYEKMSVSDLVFTPALTQYAGNGWFGGFGMTEQESELFYIIGAGDGSWGAFYEIGALWFIRCVMFGFNTNLQSMVGILNKTGLPYYNNSSLNDSAGKRLPAPLYEGIQTLTEWLFYAPPPNGGKSVFQAQNDYFNDDVRLYTRTPVTKITKNGNVITVTDANGGTANFDYVIATPTLWASQLNIQLEGFNITTEVPLEVLNARNEQHNITSCKVFFPLTQTYWNVSKIPQIIITDTFVQDAYGVQWAPNDAGALLASYTWEDDAIKMLPYNDSDLAAKVLAKLDDITMSTVGQKISTYVNANDAAIIHWSEMPYYNGCAKLYRQRNWVQNYSLLAYNQQNGAASRMYFCGENYSVEGGWTEPALRLALDAVIRLIRNSGGTFNNGFNFDTDYPAFDVAFTPNQEYPVC